MERRVGCRGVGYLVVCGRGLERTFLCVRGFSSVGPGSGLGDLVEDLCGFMESFL